MAIHTKHGPSFSTAQVRFCCQWDQTGAWRFQSLLAVAFSERVGIMDLDYRVLREWGLEDSGRCSHNLGSPTTKANSGQRPEPPGEAVPWPWLGPAF